MNKEECLKALECLYDEDVFDREVWGFVREGDNLSCVDVENAKKYYRDIIKNLIEERFENKPLEFEELKEGMWVWDNKYKAYYIVYSKKVYCIQGIYTKMVHFICANRIGHYIDFEENRYYKKCVENE